MGDEQDQIENIWTTFAERHLIDLNLMKAAREGNTELFELILDREVHICQEQVTRFCEDDSIFGSANIRDHPSRSNHTVVREAGTSRGDNRHQPRPVELMRDGGRPPSEVEGELGEGHGRHMDVSLTRFRSDRLEGVTSDGDGVLHIAAKLGHVELLRAISVREGLIVNITAKNKRGDTPLHCAAATGNVDIIDLLIRMAVVEDVIMQLLNERNRNGETCLHEAVRWDNTEAAKRLLRVDVAVQDYRDRCRGRPLVQIEDKEGVSPLYLATTLCRVEIVRLLTEERQDVRCSASYAGPEKKTALHAAVLVSKELSEHLMQWNHSLVGKADLYGNTPLHFLASNGDTSIANIILQNDECVGYIEDAEGSLPIHVAAANGKLDFIKMLLQYCPYCSFSSNNFGQNILHIAVQKGKYNVVTYVCSGQKFVDLFNTRDTAGNTALHLAVLHENQYIFRRLIRRKEVQLNFMNKKEHTPLGLALLRLPAGLYFKQTPRMWMLYDLIQAGAQLDTCRLDHFRTTQYNIFDKEIQSEILSKSAGTGAVCAVLILNISFAAPFNIAKFYLDPGTSNTRARLYALKAMIIADAFAFAFSSAATFCCTFAGWSLIDRRVRSIYFFIGLSCLKSAFLSMVIVFLLGVYAVVAPVDLQTTTAASIIIVCAVIPLLSALSMAFRNFSVLHDRLGFRTWLRVLLRGPPEQRENPRYDHLVQNSFFVIFIGLVLCGIITVLSFL